MQGPWLLFLRWGALLGGFKQKGEGVGSTFGRIPLHCVEKRLKGTGVEAGRQAGALLIQVGGAAGGRGWSQLDTLRWWDP